MTDGTESDLVDHLRDVHLKGTRGFTEDYLATLHQTLHQRTRDPGPEHSHPGMAEEAPPESEPVRM